MSSVVVEVDQYDATVTVPDDGDAKNAASVTAVGVGFQPLSNRTSFIETRRKLAYPDGAVATSGGGRVVLGTPPTQAVIETITCPAGLIIFSTVGNLRLTLANLVVGDILHITGSVHADTRVGPPNALIIGNATALTIYSGWMIDTTAADPLNVTFALTHVVTAGEAAGFDLAVGLQGPNATAINLNNPASLTVVNYRE